MSDAVALPLPSIFNVSKLTSALNAENPSRDFLADSLCSEFGLATASPLEPLVTGTLPKHDIVRPPGYAYSINFVQIPKAGVTLMGSSQHLKLKLIDKTNWFYLYPQTGGGSMSTLEFVNRMSKSSLLNKNNVTGALAGCVTCWED